jgi:hypothetical protein
MIRYAFTLLLAGILLGGCYKEMPVPGTERIDTPDWTDETHGIRDKPDYIRVFPMDLVNRMEIRIDPSDWQLLWDDMTRIIGPFGVPTMIVDDERSARFVPCDVFFQGRHWYKVGIRTKGNSSLKMIWMQGRKKFPFKLDFDEFEDRYPDIKNQRFFGFKQLSLKNGFTDRTLVKERLVDELFWRAHLPVARSALYELYLDYGEGLIYAGLYTMVEDMDDTVLANYFIDPNGVLYKPEGTSASLAGDGINTEHFKLRSKAPTHDFEDIRNLFNVLHDPVRKTDPAAWQTELDGVFGTRLFLRWLACNTVVQNWDSYGVNPHNYYLYHDPYLDHLAWIPWDHNEALWTGTIIHPVLDLDFKTIGEEWPLIRYLIDNEQYNKGYIEELTAFIQGPFNLDQLIPLVEWHLALVEPFVQREQKPFTCLDHPGDFFIHRNLLLDLVRRRYQVAVDFLKGF